MQVVGFCICLAQGCLEVPHCLGKLLGGSHSPCPWVTQIPFNLGSKRRQVYEGVIWGLPALIQATCNPTTQLALTERDTRCSCITGQGRNSFCPQPRTLRLFLLHVPEIFGAKGCRCLWASAGGRCGVVLGGMRPRTTFRWELVVRTRIWKSQLMFLSSFSLPCP